MKAFAELETPEFRSARIFVENELAGRMLDARFRDELSLPFQAADYCGPVIREMWQQLERCGYFEVRRRNNPYSLENFEFLYDGAMDWYDNDDPPFRASRRGAARAVQP